MTSGPMSPSYWSRLPIAVRLQIALNTVHDVTGPAASKTLDPMREHYKDTDALVARFVADVAELEGVLGGRDVVMARHHARMLGRSDEVVRFGAWLAQVRAIADDLAARTAPEDEPLIRIGRGLQDLFAHVPREIAFREVLTYAPPLLKTIAAHAACLDGNGFSPALMAKGTELFEACRSGDALARRDHGEQEAATAESTRLLDAIVTFFMAWASRRRVVQHSVPYDLPGFDLAEAEQWIATRPAAVAARATAKAERAAAPARTPSGDDDGRTWPWPAASTSSRPSTWSSRDS